MLFFGGIIRHALTSFGGVLVAKGYLDSGAVEAIVGAAMTLIGAGWSMYRKWKDTR